jgi:hypothetical protein
MTGAHIGGRRHVWQEHPRGYLECRWCAMRSSWDGARYACTGATVENADTAARRMRKRRERANAGVAATTPALWVQPLTGEVVP